MASETEIERLVVRLIGDATSYTQMMQQSGNAVDKTTQQVQRHVGMLDSFKLKVSQILGSMMGWGSMLGGMLGVGSLAAAGAGAIKLSADLETTSIAFETMLGSASRAKNMLEEIRVYAAKTPFDQVGLRQSAQQLMNYGISADKIMPSIKMLGDVAAGDQNKLNGLAYAFAQMSAKGKVAGDDLRQMVNWGFNPLQEMSRTTGRSMSDLTEQMHKGGITIKMLEDSFKSATSAGGRFYGMSDKQSRTLTGLWSTLKDDMSNALTQVGGVLIEKLGLKNLIAATSDGIAKYTDTVVNGITYTFDLVKNIWNAGFSWISAQWSAATVVVKNNWDIIQQVLKFSAITAAVATVVFAVMNLGTVFGILASIAAPILSLISATFLPLMPLILGAAAAVMIFVYAMGGIGPAFEYFSQIASATWEYVKAGFMNLVGFFTNFSENIGILWKWIGDNWYNVFTDMLKIVPIFATNMLSNMMVAINTLFRMWTVWQGFMVGLFKNLFSFQVQDAVLTGLIIIGQKIRDWAAAAWQTITSIFSGRRPADALGAFIKQAQGDFKKGMESTDILGDLKGVMAEGAAQMKGPLEGFESSIKELPQLNLDAHGFTDIFNVPKQAVDAINGADFGSIGMDMGANIATGIKKVGPFDAAIAGSKEAADHIAEYQAGLTKNKSMNSPVQQQQKTNQLLENLQKTFDQLLQVNKDMLGEPVFALEVNAPGVA